MQKLEVWNLVGRGVVQKMKLRLSLRHLSLRLRHLNLRPRKEVPRRSSLPRRTRTWTNHSLHNVIYLYMPMM